MVNLGIGILYLQEYFGTIVEVQFGALNSVLRSSVTNLTFKFDQIVIGVIASIKLEIKNAKNEFVEKVDFFERESE